MTLNFNSDGDIKSEIYITAADFSDVSIEILEIYWIIEIVQCIA